MKLFFYIFKDMKDLTIIDDSFDLNITSSYHISILAHSNGLSFAIMDAVRMKFLVLDYNSSIGIIQPIPIFQEHNSC